MFVLASWILNVSLSPSPSLLWQSKLQMEGFRSLREGEAVEFTFKKSSKGLESLEVTGPKGAPCVGSEKRPKGALKRRSKGDKWVNFHNLCEEALVREKDQ